MNAKECAAVLKEEQHRYLNIRAVLLRCRLKHGDQTERWKAEMENTEIRIIALADAIAYLEWISEIEEKETKK